MEIVTEFKKELNRTKLKVKLPGLYREDYQIRMLRENTVRGLLPMQAYGEGEDTVYEYNITGCISLKDLYKKKKITGTEMKEFLQQIQGAIRELELYLLNPNRLLLAPEYVFCSGEHYQFCYLPQGEEDIRAAFHRLMDEFVQWTDYQDIPSVKTVFLLHKETMKENYSLSQIMGKLEELGEEPKEGKSAGREGVGGKAGEKTSGRAGKEEDKIEKMKEKPVSRLDILWGQPGYGQGDGRAGAWESEGQMLRETDDLWSPVKRLLRRHKRPKWGEWDGLYIDEEEL